MKTLVVALLIAALAPRPARAITFVSGTAHLTFADSATSASTTVGLAVHAGDLIVAFGTFSYNGGVSVTSVTDSAGNAFQSAGSGCSTYVPYSDKVEAWYSYATHASTADIITFTFSASITNPGVSVVTYTGVNTSLPNETCTVGVTSSGTSVTSGTFAPAAPGDVAIAFVGTNNCNSISPGPAYTNRAVLGGLSDSGCLNIEDNVFVAGGAQTATATLAAADQLIMSVVTFRPYIAPDSVKTVYSYDAAGNLTAIANSCVNTAQVINPGTGTCCTPQQCTSSQCGAYPDGCGNTISCSAGCISPPPPPPPPPNDWTGCPSGYICCEPGATRCAQCYARQCP